VLRMHDLYESTVVDKEGNEVGAINDVRLVPDDSLNRPSGTALRVDGITTNKNKLATRLGLHHYDPRGSWLLKALAWRLKGRGTYIPWSYVERCEGRTVHLRVTRHELLAPGQLQAQ
jgi:hypothetical protein